MVNDFSYNLDLVFSHYFYFYERGKLVYSKIFLLKIVLKDKCNNVWPDTVFISPRSHHEYYTFGLLFVVILLCLLTATETNVLLCHSSLRHEVSERKTSGKFYLCVYSTTSDKTDMH